VYLSILSLSMSSATVRCYWFSFSGSGGGQMTTDVKIIWSQPHKIPNVHSYAECTCYSGILLYVMATRSSSLYHFNFQGSTSHFLNVIWFGTNKIVNGAGLYFIYYIHVCLYFIYYNMYVCTLYTIYMYVCTLYIIYYIHVYKVQTYMYIVYKVQTYML
jgi:hypothetical protein